MLAELVVEDFGEQAAAGEAIVLLPGSDDLVEDHLERVHFSRFVDVGEDRL